MKNKRFIIGVVICIAIALFLLDSLRHKETVTPSGTNANQAVENPATIKQPVKQPGAAKGNSDAVPESVYLYMQHKREDPVWDWKQPIYFYGRVMDENGRFVQGAIVNFEWSNLSEKGTSKSQTESDVTGLFSIHETGKRISITVSKVGYYTPRTENLRTYEYANPADGLFTPDINQPVVFHLRKKGQSEPLINCSQKINILPGSQVSFDPKKCLLNSGEAVLQCDLLKNKSGGTNRTEWVLRLGVPSGGIQFATNEFSFLAPDANYQPFVDLTLDSPRPENWQNNGYAGGVVFVKTASGFGKIEIRMIPGSSYFRLVSYFNPSGSRNLEFNPNNASQSGQ